MAEAGTGATPNHQLEYTVSAVNHGTLLSL